MSCIAAIVSSPVLGSCRSPSLKSCSEIESSSEMHSGSPVLRSPLNNSVSPCVSLRQVSLGKSSPPQENLGLNNSTHHLSPCRNSLQVSRLRPIRDENHPPVQWNESSPLKHGDTNVLGSSLRLSQRSRQRFPGRIKVKEEQSEDVLTEINGASNGELENNSLRVLSPPLKRKRPPKLDIPKSPKEVQMVNADEKITGEENIGYEGDHYGFYCKKGRKEVMEDTHNVTTNILGDSQRAFFGVYDGHGGRKAADFVAESRRTPR